MVLVSGLIWTGHLNVVASGLEQTNSFFFGNLNADYSIQSWTVEQGLPHNRIHCLLQTSDGYLWIGSHEGLARYDGLRLSVHDRATVPAFRSQDILSLAESPPGCLWIGTKDGLVRYQDHVFTGFPLQTNSNPIEVRSIAPRRQGGIWLATSLMLMHFDRERATYYTNYPGYDWEEFPQNLIRGRQQREVNYVLEDGRGTLWISDARGLVRLDPGEENFKMVYEPHPGLGFWAWGANRLVCDPEGGIWFGNERGLFRHWDDHMEFYSASRHGLRGVSEPILWDLQQGLWIRSSKGGISRWHQREFIHYPPPREAADDTVGCLERDREGFLWMGMDNSGLQCLRSLRLRVLTAKDGLAHDHVKSLSTGPDGSIWMATASGLSRYINGAFQTYHFQKDSGVPPPNHNDFVSVLAGKRDNIWVSTRGCLFEVKNQSLVECTPRFGPEPRVSLETQCLYEDRAGGLWVGTDKDIYHFYKGQWERFGKTDSDIPGIHRALVSGHVLGILEDAGGALWIGTREGVNRLHHQTWQAFTEANGLPVREVVPVLADADGTMWFSSAQGLLRFKQERFFLISSQHGLLESAVLNVIEDDWGWLWLNGHRGIQRVRKRDLNRVADGDTNHLNILRFSEKDGMLTAATSGGYQPNSCKARDGRLWFPTSRGVVVIDPRVVQNYSVPPLVVIQQVLADQEVIYGEGIKSSRHSGQALRLAPGRAQALLIRYTANCFSDPDRARFRYQLEGFDKQWQEDKNNRRTAIYTNLRPGLYRFRIQAFDHYGSSSALNESISFILAPHFYETWTFYLLTAAVLVLVAATIHSCRMRIQRRLLALEHERALAEEKARIARDMHDDLGGSLTKIKLLSELDDTQLAHPCLQQISGISRAVMQSMDELVWAVNPKKDNLEELANYLASYAEDYFRLSVARCRLEIPVLLPAFALTSQQRHNLFMAFKEALNNIAKHAKATEVIIRLTVENNTLALCIQDNGAGLSINEPIIGKRAGNGLMNMPSRMEAIGGGCKIESHPGQGTKVHLWLAIGNKSGKTKPF